jgi:hypothetical protein
MLSTPGGSSVSSATSLPSHVALHGVSGAALSTAVQPAISAGTTFDRLSMNGKFQGVIRPATPSGSRRTRRLLFAPKNSCTPSSCSQSYFSAHSMSQSMSWMHESCCTA